ncbi:MAG: ATP-binding protein, partial [Candidatus Marinimicrobia bacterium]|nr:ATP-binding protein [Candidatus Neomarinimicrobiota bacterium]
VAIGMKVAQNRKRVLFFTAEKLIEQLNAADVSGKLPSYLDIMGRIDLLIIDELGYLKMTRQSAELFFKLIAKRYEKGSIIVTSNKAFEQWGEIFMDDIVAAAILDRLLHHSYPFFIQGKSFRMKNITGK